MNYLHRKKLAFMKLLDNIKSAFGYPVVIKDAKEGNAVDYTIYGNTVEENLLTYPFADTTKTVNGITFTDNKDVTITANGTATEHSYFYATSAESFNLDNKKYTLSDCPEGGSDTTYYAYISAVNGDKYVKNEKDTGAGVQR